MGGEPSRYINAAHRLLSSPAFVSPQGTEEQQPPNSKVSKGWMEEQIVIVNYCYFVLPDASFKLLDQTTK